MTRRELVTTASCGEREGANETVYNLQLRIRNSQKRTPDADDTQNRRTARRARACRASVGRLFLQPVCRAGRSDQGAVGSGREPAAAAQRSDSESRRDGQ